jgi:hypothetical protein
MLEQATIVACFFNGFCKKAFGYRLWGHNRIVIASVSEAIHEYARWWIAALRSQ